LPSLYNYSFNPDLFTYQFETDNGIVYQIAFVVENSFSEVGGIEVPDVYHLIIQNISQGRSALDASVSITIIAIIEDFFLHTERAIIYVCDNGDGRGQVRHKTFDRWFNNSDLPEYVDKVDNTFGDGEDTLFSSVLVHKENVNRQTIIDIYQTMVDIFNEK